MKRHIADVYTLVLHFLQQILREMKAGCRRRRRTHDFGIHGLIPLPVLQLLFYIGRQGHFSEPVEHFQKNSVILEPYQPVAALQNLGHLRCQFAVAKAEPCPLAEMFPRAHQTLPGLFAAVNEQQHLAGPAARQTLA